MRALLPVCCDRSQALVAVRFTSGFPSVCNSRNLRLRRPLSDSVWPRCRLLGLSLAAGRLWEGPCGGLAEAAAACEALMTRLLEQLTPSTTPLLWLLLRLLLDQQARAPPGPYFRQQMCSSTESAELFG